MKLTLSTTEWQLIAGLTEGTCYYLQSQGGTVYYTVSSTVPSDLNQGIKDTWFKFKKGSQNVYIRALNAPTTICIETI